MRNPNPSLPNRNHLYLAKSGHGKSQALKQNPYLVKRGARVALWDPNNDHQCHGYDRIGDWVAAVKRAHLASLRTGCGFRIGYQGVDSHEAYAIWCKTVTAILDGNLDTVLLAEELSTVSKGTAKAPLPAAKLLNQCRKYGGIFLGTSPKPQEINKTYFDNCDHLVVGGQKTAAQRRKMAEEIGVTPEEIKGLAPLEFFYDDSQAVVRQRYRYVG